MTTLGRQIVLAARPKGRPELTDFRLEETSISTPAAGQLLLEGGNFGKLIVRLAA